MGKFGLRLDAHEFFAEDKTLLLEVIDCFDACLGGFQFGEVLQERFDGVLYIGIRRICHCIFLYVLLESLKGSNVAVNSSVHVSSHLYSLSFVSQLGEQLIHALFIEQGLVISAFLLFV